MSTSPKTNTADGHCPECDNPDGADECGFCTRYEALMNSADKERFDRVIKAIRGNIGDCQKAIGRGSGPMSSEYVAGVAD